MGSDLNAVSCAVAVGVVVLGDRVLFKVFFLVLSRVLFWVLFRVAVAVLVPCWWRRCC